eukprot:COSAG01_NODE_23119_length_827_cov_5.850275_1_plen_70_part_00
MEDQNTLTEYEVKIQNQIPYVDVRPYSHNIIAMTLAMISNKFGGEVASDTIRKLGLDRMGWVINENKNK